MKKKQRGSLILEYILILPIMVLLIFSAVYLSMAFHDYNALNEVAREAARLGVVGNKNDDIRNAAMVRSNELLTRLYAVDNAQVTRIRKTNLNDEKYLEITISARKVPANSMGFIDHLLPDRISANMRMRVEVDPEGIKDTDYNDEK